METLSGSRSVGKRGVNDRQPGSEGEEEGEEGYEARLDRTTEEMDQTESVRRGNLFAEILQFPRITTRETSAGQFLCDSETPLPILRLSRASRIDPLAPHQSAN